MIIPNGLYLSTNVRIAYVSLVIITHTHTHIAAEKKNTPSENTCFLQSWDSTLGDTHVTSNNTQAGPLCLYAAQGTGSWGAVCIIENPDRSTTSDPASNSANAEFEETSSEKKLWTFHHMNPRNTTRPCHSMYLWNWTYVNFICTIYSPFYHAAYMFIIVYISSIYIYILFLHSSTIRI